MKRSQSDGRKRVVIENVTPQIEEGHFPAKRVVGEEVAVEADVFTDGHDQVKAVLVYGDTEDSRRFEVPMTALGNDRWRGTFTVEKMCPYVYTVKGWVDRFATWQADLGKKYRAGQDVSVELTIGAELITHALPHAEKVERERMQEIAARLAQSDSSAAAMDLATGEEISALMHRHPDRGTITEFGRQLSVWVDRSKAGFSAWYELFPRSADQGGHGTLRDSENRLPMLAQMGFDILYFPPIHPIGKTNRKGRNNVPTSGPDDPGSPWAIGCGNGGHKAIHPALGTLEDFRRLAGKAQEHGLEIALDLAFQCSPDHPYLREHPEWFKWRPDGSIQHAENPPKKYEDIVPFDFECGQWRELWEELAGVVRFWVERGVRIFRVDNPHTKPFAFWQWLIAEIRRDHPDVFFLAEAFTRPKVMYRLAKIGFSQSYTYFTWRNTKWEITSYITELTQGASREFFRPNFWPNTPDILPEFVLYGGRPAFVLRLALAATLSANYGVYGPAYEHCVAEAFPDKEEYAHSEKYEIKHWDWDRPDSLRELVGRINQIRRANPALQSTWNVRFHEVDNEMLLFFVKATPDHSNVIMVVANLDPFHRQSGWVNVPIDELGIPEGQTYLMHDLIAGDKFVWQGSHNYVELDPFVMPMHIFRVNRRLRRETDFDYYM